MNGAYPTQPKETVLDEDTYKMIRGMSIKWFYGQLDKMDGAMMIALSERIPGTINRLKESEEWNRNGVINRWEGASIENADKLKAEWELLESKLKAVEARGSRCSWSNCKSEWRHLLGGKRRSKSSNKPKKSAKRVKTAKRSKSRKIRRQRK